MQNIRQAPEVEVRIEDRTFEGRGRFVQESGEERTTRKLLVAKYYGRDRVASTAWEAPSLQVAVDLKL